MGRYFGWMCAVGLVAGVSAVPAAAQVRVGVYTPSVGVSVAVGSPRVHVVDRSYPPYDRGRYVRPVPVRGWERERGRDRTRREREYRRDVRDARREYARDIRDARRDYARDIREAQRDRRR
jgi:hypothetical protein